MSWVGFLYIHICVSLVLYSYQQLLYASRTDLTLLRARVSPRIINDARRRLSHSFEVNYARSIHSPEICIQCRCRLRFALYLGTWTLSRVTFNGPRAAVTLHHTQVPKKKQKCLCILLKEYRTSKGHGNHYNSQCSNYYIDYRVVIYGIFYYIYFWRIMYKNEKRSNRRIKE